MQRTGPQKFYYANATKWIMLKNTYFKVVTWAFKIVGLSTGAQQWSDFWHP